MSKTYDAREVKRAVEMCIAQCRVAKGNMLKKSKENLQKAIHTLESYNDTYVLISLSREDEMLLKEMDLFPEGVL